jgi:hypothetical protein
MFPSLFSFLSSSVLFLLSFPSFFSFFLFLLSFPSFFSFFLFLLSFLLSFPSFFYFFLFSFFEIELSILHNRVSCQIILSVHFYLTLPKRPNVGKVAVPDEKLDLLAKVLQSLLFICFFNFHFCEHRTFLPILF